MLVLNEFFFTILRIPYFWFTHLHASSIASIFCICDFITILLQYLPWSKTLHFYKIILVIDVSPVVLFKPIQLFRILPVNTMMHDHMINYYFYSHHYFTVCLFQVISFIVLLIQSIIIGNSKVRAAVCFKWILFFTILIIPYVWCIHIHNSSLSSIIYIFGFITFLLQFLIWSHTICFWKSRLFHRVNSSCSTYTNTIVFNSTC